MDSSRSARHATHAGANRLSRHQFADRRPRVDLAGSIFLFIALGFGLYGGVFLFPLFTQNLLHFTPTETGLALMPGGMFILLTFVLVSPAILILRKPRGQAGAGDMHRAVFRQARSRVKRFREGVLA